MNQIEKMHISPVVQGFWRLNEWKKSDQELNAMLHELVENGITTMDHADIYGDYSCEGIFGEALKLSPELRDDIQIVTKCGIVLKSNKISEFNYHKYDYSETHIMKSVERSLKEMNIGEIDLLLLHRPSPLMDADKTAAVLNQLKKSGKVKHFGVSNYKRDQYELLADRLQQYDIILETNQLELSPANLEHLEDGTMNDMTRMHTSVMAWSPLAGGTLFEEGSKMYALLNRFAVDYETTPDVIAYAFLNRLPHEIYPISGSGNIKRSINALKGSQLILKENDWFEIYKTSIGRDIL